MSTLFYVYLGNGEYERAHGERCVGVIDAESIDVARRLLALGKWTEMDSHDVGPGYTLSATPPKRPRGVRGW